jgi:cellulose synthase operon protein C
LRGRKGVAGSTPTLKHSFAQESAMPLPSSRLAAAILLLLAAGCSRDPGPAQLLASAARHQAGGDNHAAIIELKNVLQRTPDHAAARVQLGDAYLESGDVLSAEKEFRRARDAGAQAAVTEPRIGAVLLLQQRYEQVLTELQEDTTLPAPAQADISALRGYAMLGLQRTGDAARLFALALALQPGHAVAQLGQARMALQSGAVEQAMQAVAGVLAAHPDNLEALRLRGDLYRRSGDHAKALDSYRQAARLRPAHLQVRLDTASLLAAQSRLDEARKELAAAARIAPGSAAVIYMQALLATQEKNYPAALERLLLILRAAPDHPPSNLLAAGIYFAQNSLPQAEQHIQRFLASEPRDPFGTRMAAAIALRSGKAGEAAALLEPLLERYPDDAQLHAAAGEAYMRMQAYAKASASFDKATAKAPPSAALRMSQAISQLGLGDNARAVAVLEQALQAPDETPAGSAAGGAQQRAGALLVVAHMRAGAYDKALAAVQALEQRQNNPALQNLKGGVLLARKDPDGARSAFEAALALQPGYVPALQNLAQLDVLAGRPDAARRRYEAALARDSNDTELMTSLARLAQQRGQGQAARGWFERAYRAAPEATAPALQLAAYYLKTGESTRALVLAQKLQATNPASAEALAMLGTARAASGDAEGALESYTALAGRQPDNPAVQLQVAGMCMALERPADALAAVRKALALQPEHGPALATAVRLSMELRSWDQAVALARAAQARPANAALGYRLEGDIEMARARPAPALALFQKAYALEPSGPLAISLHRALTATGKAGDAAAQLTRWLDQHPRDVPTRLYLASTQLAAADYRSAMAHYEQILATEPDHVVALNDLAWSCQQTGDKRALAFAEKAYALAPANPSVADTLGWILAQQGQPGRALPLLKKATDSAPQAGDIRFHYASALLRTGERGEARRQLERLQSDARFQHRDEVRALLATL